jgi:hypothetical protein
MPEREPPLLPEARTHGQRVLERLRNYANEENAYFAPSFDGEDVFRALYLTERHTSVPEQFVGDDPVYDLHMDVRALFDQVFQCVRDELREQFGPQPIWIVVDPDLEDRTNVVVCTNESLLLMDSSKAWRFFWESEDAMAETLDGWYTTAADRLGRELGQPVDLQRAGRSGA